MSDTQLQELRDKAIEAGREAVLDAVETHRRMGRSIVVMEEGQIKHIKARDLKPRPLPGDEIENAQGQG
jgi:hypothetical protein